MPDEVESDLPTKCVIAIDVTGQGYTIAVYPLGSKPAGHALAVYGCRTLAALDRVVDCLASGRAVPRGYNSQGR